MIRSSNDINLDIGQNIRRERLRLGLSQVELGEKIGKSYASMSYLENGKTRIMFYDLYLLSKCMNISIYEFLRGIE